MKNSKVFLLVSCALFVALNTLLSQIAIPIGTVPVTLTHISIFLAAALLGWKWGTVAQIIYVTLGAIGIPVFAGFAGGVGHVAGPLGGFIAGYIACAFVTALVVRRFGTSKISFLCAMYAGWLVTYALGVPWLMFSLSINFATAIISFVLPFLLGDFVKTVLCLYLIKRLKPLFDKKLKQRDKSAL